MADEIVKVAAIAMHSEMAEVDDVGWDADASAQSAAGGLASGRGDGLVGVGRTSRWESHSSPGTVYHRPSGSKFLGKRLLGLDPPG